MAKGIPCPLLILVIHFLQTFHQLGLEDEPGLPEGENVTIPNLFTESRTLLSEQWKELVTDLLTALFAALLAG